MTAYPSHQFERSITDHVNISDWIATSKKRLPIKVMLFSHQYADSGKGKYANGLKKGDLL
jgi:hypothetical protein